MVFDLADYKRHTRRLEWADLEVGSAFRARPLDADTLRCLRYMHDVEFHTVCYLRELLMTPAHDDPEITAFLSFWAFEEFWHGEAISEILAAHDEPFGSERIIPVRLNLARSERWSPLITNLASVVVGNEFVALHMTWGAINEWTTQAGYAQLARRAEHPILAELLGRIARQEGRHIDFYASQAHRRLDASPRAQRLTRLALRRLWKPVGSTVLPAAETDFMVHHLFSGNTGLDATRRIDRHIDRLPGLAGLGLVEMARAKATQRVAA